MKRVNEESCRNEKEEEMNEEGGRKGINIDRMRTKFRMMLRKSIHPSINPRSRFDQFG